jgi:hypothetical protein
MSEIAFKLSQICSVLLGERFTRTPRNLTGTRWAANFHEPDGRQLSILGPEHK